MIKKREAVRQGGLPYFVCRDTAARRAARPAIRLKAERGTNMFNGTTFANDIMESEHIDYGCFNSENQLAHEQFIIEAPAQIHQRINNRLPRPMICDFPSTVCLDNR